VLISVTDVQLWSDFAPQELRTRTQEVNLSILCLESQSIQKVPGSYASTLIIKSFCSRFISQLYLIITIQASLLFVVRLSWNKINKIHCTYLSWKIFPTRRITLYRGIIWRTLITLNVKMSFLQIMILRLRPWRLSSSRSQFIKFLSIRFILKALAGWEDETSKFHTIEFHEKRVSGSKWAIK
jgi:hypothetical protein